ncbi:MAG: hypothetical protein JWO06_1513 [Bacteroidota bacterium]|nr:hypothetical protein [Bacteroidota bacterium]
MNVYTIFGLVAVAAFALALIRFVVNRPPNILITFLQDFVGVFFMFSGFVKAVDPLGTSYKMHEYFEAFAQEGFRPFWEYLANCSTFFAIAMIALELLVGFALVIGWKPRLTTGIIWLLTLFFTFLTGYTYLSGYCISKLFLVVAAAVLLLFASVAFPAKTTTRNNLTFFSVGILIVFLLLSKFSGHLFMCEFTESKMKVTDCGCFGDFIKLKPWETFYKDLILDVFIIILLLNEKHIRPVFGAAVRNGLAFFGGLIALLFCLYNVYSNEPVIDFRPYKIGNDIRDLRIEKRPVKMQMTFVMMNTKTKEQKEFSYEDVIANRVDRNVYDTQIKRIDKILDPGIPAIITNLHIEDEDNDLTDSLLSNPNYSLMVVAYSLGKTHESAFNELNAIAAGTDKLGLKFFAVTVNDGKVDEFRHRNQAAYPFYYADETPLKTMIRSNPGLILLKNGVVINKWHYRHLPTFDELNQKYFSKK